MFLKAYSLKRTSAPPTDAEAAPATLVEDEKRDVSPSRTIQDDTAGEDEKRVPEEIEDLAPKA